MIFFKGNLSHCSFTNSDVFSCRNFLIPSNFDLERNESLLRKTGETQKSFKVQITFELLRSCLFNHSEYSCPFWSTRDNHEFLKLQFSRILSDKIRWTPRGKSIIQKYMKTNYRNITFFASQIFIFTFPLHIWFWDYLSPLFSWIMIRDHL